ncbi:MAG TPA: MATE family efflux transporter [Lachnospiraceae bacterium]|nr:MATE family efflux transporter [Lachnospiraceae bacterium]
MKQVEKNIYMTTEPVERLVLKLAVPTIISMLITSFYNMADTFFVGKINTEATAAVGVVFSVMAIIQAIGFLFGHGSGVFISRKLGENKIKEATIMTSSGFFYSILCGILLAIIGLLFLNPLSYFLGSTDAFLSYTKDYLGIILFGAPIMTASIVLNNQLRYQGNAVYAMVGIVSGAVINIALDPLLIFVFDLGISGAAIATIISQFISLLLLLLGTTKGGNIKLNVKNISFSWYYLKTMLQGGFPSLCRQGLASIAVISLNLTAKAYGIEAIAGMSIVSRITMFANSTMIGFGQGFQPVCGFNYGAKLYGRVRKAFWFCVKSSFVFLIVIGLLCFIFATNLVELFRKGDLKVIEVGTFALQMQCITFPLNSWIILCNMMLQAVGKSLSASIAAASRQGLFFLPIIWILPRLFGIVGIQLAQPIADVLAVLLTLPLGLSFLRQLKRDERNQIKLQGELD